MKHAFVASKKAAWVVFTSLALGLTGLADAESGTSGKDTLAASGTGILDDNPTRGGTEKSLGSSRSGSSGSGAAGGSNSSTPQGSSPGGSTGDKGFSNLRENKGGSGSQSTLGGSTDSKAGDAGTGGGTGGSSTGGSK
ncbi:hypothetical protein [Nitrosospira briensis]|uniref:hypothetical protein n=1 Tax=Nitrosospira briensis TaxID=35799 RepID=UPI0008EC1E86|nr:hypothetical protein [Nitrosospira briensis]SFO37283.1 hypothetical protein SAMN05216332_11278 [Nitrosospira briensis]